MKKTPLHDRHVARKARMGEFGGWDMPIQYAGILAEHEQTRTKAAVFDICHMGEFELSGPTAEADLDRLLTCRVAGMEIGRVRYGYLPNEAGGTLDDLTVYRLEPERFMLVTNAGTAAKDATWIRRHLSAQTRFEDVSQRLAKLDVQGPRSRPAMEKILDRALPEIGYFRAVEIRLAGVPVLLSRTGYTGEWGYELYFAAEEAGRLWDLLLTSPEIEPAGLGARDVLRLEMGYPLYGHELSESRSAVTVSRGAFIDWSKDFIGKAGAERERDRPTERLVGLTFASRRAARRGDAVFAGATRVGEVTGGSFSPALGRAVALAFVRADRAEAGSTLETEIRGRRFPARVVEPPFYRGGSARRPPNEQSA